jgi:tetratricopeptide (TPR) repeat protein
VPASGRIEELRKRYDENQRRFFAPLANEYRKSGDLETAITLCRTHLADAPANLNGQIVFGQALYDAGTLDEARGAFETAISLDPENLIALRHLGDISREQGNIPKAREWYRRVLDADRRNEEVLAIMEDLDAVEAASGPDGPPMMMGTPIGGAFETIEIEEPLVHAPAPSRPSIMSLIGGAPPEEIVEPPIARAPVSIHAVDTIEIETTSLAPEAPVEEPADSELAAAGQSQREEAATHREAEAAAVDADGIDFGMVDAGPSVSADPPVPDSSFGFDVDLGAASDIQVATSVGDTGDFGVVDLPDDAPFRGTEEVKPVGIETTSDSLTGTINLDTPVAVESVEVEAFAPPDIDLDIEDAEPARARLELVKDDPIDSIDLAEEDLTPAVPEFAVPEFAVPEPEVPEPEVPEPEVPEPPVPPPSIPRRSTPVVFNFDLSVDEPSGTPTPFETLAIDDPEPVAQAQPAEAFATETMAELYVKQGLRHEAIGVYRQLIEARPHDASLRQRLAELEDDGRIPDGATARDFFAALSRRTSRGRGNLPDKGGSLDRLFDGASVARHDEHAAESLSAAFGSGPTQHEESALDRVFNTGPARPPGR